MRSKPTLSPFTLHLSPLLWAILFVVLFTSPTNAANITATLDDAAAPPLAPLLFAKARSGAAGGASVFAVNDSAATEQSHIDSDSNGVLKGCLRVDSGGSECTVTEGLVIGGNAGIGTRGLA